MMRVFWAFARRDFLIWTSYRLAFFWELLKAMGGTLVLFFVGNAIDAGTNIHLAKYSGSYFEFALVGVGFLSYLGGVMSAFNDSIREGQQTGTLEVILISPHRLPAILIGSSGFYHIIGLSRLIIYFLLGWCVFGLWRFANYAGAILVILMSALCFSSVSLLSSSFTVAFKKGNPVLGIYGLLNLALGGLLFPVGLLPKWLQGFSAYLPLTHALEGMRLALNGYALGDLLPSLIGLAAISLILLPLGAIAFVWSINLAKDQGSLAQY